MVSRFHVTLLVAIILISIIATPYENYRKTWVSKSKKVMQTRFIDYYTKNDNICQLLHAIQTIVHQIIVFTVSRNTAYINKKRNQTTKDRYDFVLSILIMNF